MVELEAGAAAESEASAAAASRALARFRETMTRLVGTAGFSALVRRALDRVSAERDFLREARSSADPSSELEGLGEAPGERDPADVHAALESVLAHVIDLVFRFLGPRLTMQLVRSAWSDLGIPGEPGGPTENP